MKVLNVQPNLPQEIIDIIVGYLSDDAASLPLSSRGLGRQAVAAISSRIS